MFARVAAVGDAETEVEVEVLEQAPLEVMPLDHPEAVDGPIAHRELHAEGSDTGTTVTKCGTTRGAPRG